MKIKTVAAFFGSTTQHYFNYYHFLTHKSVAAYAAKNNWRLVLPTAPISDELLAKSNWDGVIILGPRGKKDLETILRSGIPVVNLSMGPDVTVPRVVVDNKLAGRQAAEHLLSRGHKNCSYFCLDHSSPKTSELRWEGFKQTIEESGFKATKYASSTAEETSSLDRTYEWIRAILSKMSFPSGIFCYNDYTASLVLSATIDEKLLIPEDVAIVGMDNDPVFCESSMVDLSSVRVPVSEITLKGSELLAKLMDGEQAPTDIQVVPTGGVNAAKSTDSYASKNVHVLNASAFIQENFRKNIGLADIADACNISLNSLKRVFRRDLKCSPLKILHDHRMNEARALLKNTGLPVADIALMSGLNSCEYFCRYFKKHTGFSPLQYRKSSQI